MKRTLFLILFGIIVYGCGKKPVSNFSWFPTNPKIGEEVIFTNLSTNANSYDWNFGDMSIGREKNPVHTYSTEGDHIVDLQANNGLKHDIKTVTITVRK